MSLSRALLDADLATFNNCFSSKYANDLGDTEDDAVNWKSFLYGDDDRRRNSNVGILENIKQGVGGYSQNNAPALLVPSFSFELEFKMDSEILILITKLKCYDHVREWWDLIDLW